MRNVIKILNAYAKEKFSDELRVCGGNDSCYYYKEKTIVIERKTFNNPEDTMCYSDKLFMNFLRDNFDLTLEDKYYPLVTFLHEVGHYMTYDMISVEENDLCENIKEEIEEETGELTDDTQEWQDSYIRYMCLIDEYLASEWACEWIENHPEEVKSLIKKIWGE